MSISSVGGSIAAQYAPATRPTPPPMTNTAKLLGMSEDDLRQARQSGTKLVDLAAQKGVSKDDLVKSIADDLKADRPADAPQLSDDQLTQMATNVAEGERAHHHRHAHHAQSGGEGSGSDPDSELASLAQALDVDPNELRDHLKSALGFAAGATATGQGADGSSTSASFDTYA
jgi:hypothetical protein